MKKIKAVFPWSKKNYDIHPTSLRFVMKIKETNSEAIWRVEEYDIHNSVKSKSPLHLFDIILAFCFLDKLHTISHYAGKRLFGPHKKILHLFIHILFLFDNLTEWGILLTWSVIMNGFTERFFENRVLSWFCKNITTLKLSSFTQVHRT